LVAERPAPRAGADPTDDNGGDRPETPLACAASTDESTSPWCSSTTAPTSKHPADRSAPRSLFDPLSRTKASPTPARDDSAASRQKDVYARLRSCDLAALTSRHPKAIVAPARVA